MKYSGIAIVGLNGSGKSTLAHALAKETGFYEIDVEDLYFPEQEASRKWSLDHAQSIATEHLGDIPFSITRSKAEVEEKLQKLIEEHPQFILSGVSLNWHPDILRKIELVFWIKTPTQERVRRVEDREIRRFGERVLSGGDMYEQQKSFREVIAGLDEEKVRSSLTGVPCPVVLLDGTASVQENVDKALSCLIQRCSR